MPLPLFLSLTLRFLERGTCFLATGVAASDLWWARTLPGKTGCSFGLGTCVCGFVVCFCGPWHHLQSQFPHVVIPESANVRIALGILFCMSWPSPCLVSSLTDSWPQAVSPLMREILTKALCLDVEPSLYLSMHLLGYPSFFRYLHLPHS